MLKICPVQKACVGDGGVPVQRYDDVAKSDLREKLFESH